MHSHHELNTDQNHLNITFDPRLAEYKIKNLHLLASLKNDSGESWPIKASQIKRLLPFKV